MIPVTQSFTPPLEEYIAYLEQVWETKWLTNRGKLVKELENQIQSKYGTHDLLVVNNGTVALQIAIRALQSTKKQIITTPFSYVATTSSIIWEGKTPVFADINEKTLCIDPDKVKTRITDQTAAILATHVFGNICDVHRLKEISDQYQIPVIYDAAHCFGVEFEGKSAFNFGHIATTSFHATKLFHTGEGGAVFCSDSELSNRIFYMHNFGHKGKIDFQGLGINGKISEINAALGLSVLPYIDELILLRKSRVETYHHLLKKSALQFPIFDDRIKRNYAYFPVIFESEKQLFNIEKKLNQQDIFPRRYFYPSLDNLPYTQGGVDQPVSNSISSRILCLPLWHSLEISAIEKICTIITSQL